MAIGGRKMLAVGSACVVSVGVATALLWRKRMTVGKQAGGACPSSQWNEKEVCEWMRGLGVSEATRNVFQRERITGCVLMGLSEQDIALLSATKKDSELIFEAMKVGVNEPLEAFARESQSLFVRLATGEQRTMAERKQLLQDVLYAFKSFQMLGPEQQASALLPLSRQVSAATKVAQEAKVGTTITDKASPKSCGERLSKVLNALRTGEILSIPLEDRIKKVEELFDEVRSVSKLAEANPDWEEKSDILRICEVIENMLEGIVKEREENDLPRTPQGGTEDSFRGSNFDLVTEFLQLREIAELVYSEEFEALPDLQRFSMVEMFLERISKLQPFLDQVKGREGEVQLRRLAVNLQRVLEVSGRTNSSSTPPKIINNVEYVLGVIGEQDFLKCNLEEREERIHELLVILLASRRAAEALGAEGQPLVVFVDQLAERLQVVVESFKAEEEAEHSTESESGTNNVAKFIQTLKKMHKRVPLCHSLEDARGLAENVNFVVAAADNCQVPWRTNTEAQEIQARLVEDLENAERAFSNATSEESHSQEAATVILRLREHPPQNMESLLPYLDNLRMLCASGVNTDTEEIMTLREAIHDAYMRLNSRDTIEGDFSEHLMEMSNTLREGNLSEKVLDEFEMILACLSEISLDESTKEAISLIKQQIQIQRNVAMSEEEESQEDSQEKSQEEWEEEINSEDEPDGKCELKENLEEGKEKPEEAVSAQSDCNIEGATTEAGEVKTEINHEASSSTNVDPAIIERDLSLFPRIEAHVALTPEEFAKTCTPFDLSFIKLLLKRLEGSSIDSSMKERVRETQKKLADHLGESGELSVPQEDKGTPLRVSAKQTSSEDNGLNLVVQTGKEAAEKVTGEVDDTKLRDKVEVSEQPSARERSDWEGKSVAILINDPQNTKEEHQSVKHELSVLDDALVQNGFHVMHAADSMDSRDAFEAMVKDAVQSHPSRVFFYTNSRQNGDASNTLTFHDGTHANLGDIMLLTKPAARTIVANCHPNRLDMNYRHAQETGPCISVELSPQARAGIQSRRCAIFDGIFTPIIAGFLNEEKERAMCPEDMMRRVVSTVSDTACDAGLGGGSAGRMGYFC